MKNNKIEDIIRKGMEDGKIYEQINAELKVAGSNVRLVEGKEGGWTEQEMKEGFVASEGKNNPVQRSLDMSRKIEFANTVQTQYVSGNKYEIHYNQDGYAVKAVHIG